MSVKKTSASSPIRCGWVGTDELMAKYHDTEWGRAEYDSEALFEKLILDGFQAGLSWQIILHRRESLRRAFCGFRPSLVARFDEEKITELLKDKGIIRNRQKVQAAVTSAQSFLTLKARGIEFGEYLWRFASDYPPEATSRRNKAPTETEASRQMSRSLKKAGFSFCGPTICYAFMQAVGMVNDHEATCFLAHL